MLTSLLTLILIVVIKVGQSVKKYVQDCLDDHLCNPYHIHLENVSLQCKDSDAVEGTMECLEPDSICLVKRVGMCMLLLF